MGCIIQLVGLTMPCQLKMTEDEIRMQEIEAIQSMLSKPLKEAVKRYGKDRVLEAFDLGMERKIIMEWISIKDNLPPHDGTPFLGYDPTTEDIGKIYVLIYVPEKKYTGEFEKLSSEECYMEASGEGYFTWKPTHWMPLPEPPKETNARTSQKIPTSPEKI